MNLFFQKLLSALRKQSDHWEVLDELKPKLQELMFVDKKCESIEDVSKVYLNTNLFKFISSAHAKPKVKMIVFGSILQKV